LANINLVLQKGQYLSLTKKLKEKDEEILLSDLVSQEIPPMTGQEILELYRISKYSSEKLQNFFDHAKAIWELVNDSISLTVLNNSKKIESKQGLFIIKNKEKNYLYEFVIKEIKKNFPDVKCYIKKICEIENQEITPELFENKKTLIKNLSSEEVHRELILFKVNHDDNFPFNETLIPLTKRKLLNFIQQSKIINKVNLTKTIQ
jgi:D-lyxose ketol-isomerase